MGHGKLKKFAENQTFRCLLQPSAADVLADKAPGSKALVLRDHAIKGKWGEKMFGNDNPIVLELGCGKGDYTIALAARNPGVNFIGVDIKGARLWAGAKYATEHAMGNVAFLRTRIEFIGAFFGPSEVSQIWLTFSDPQLRGSENARLSSPMFLERYRGFLKPGGIVHLKTDSRYLYEYTQAVCKVNNLPVIAYGTDIYSDGVHTLDQVQGIFGPGHILPPGPGPATMPHSTFSATLLGPGPAPKITPRPNTPWTRSTQVEDINVVFDVQTFYEKMFLEMGLPITYMAFTLEHEGPFVSPGEAFDHSYWLEQEGPRRSFSHQPNKKN